MRVTSKGQVTIPKEVREKLGVQPGDEVGFREEGQAIVVVNESREAKPNAGLELVKHLLGKGPAMRKGRPMITSEELMEMTRGPFNDLDPH
jgi:AbrB family looped-hinge helix DNA binding protein